MATRGRPENDGASFLLDETSALLLSRSPSHCAINCSEISCFIQELCKDCAAGGTDSSQAAPLLHRAVFGLIAKLSVSQILR